MSLDTTRKLRHCAFVRINYNQLHCTNKLINVDLLAPVMDLSRVTLNYYVRTFVAFEIFHLDVESWLEMATVLLQNSASLWNSSY